MINRELLEKREHEILKPYAALSTESKGRRYPEDEHPWRTVYQRDRDRIIHCTSFRRLDQKTQVFVSHEGDNFRTRLTHSLEVAQTARSVARALGLNEDLSEAVALSHDLGHPPFGHSGESRLRKRMTEHDGFEHNQQSLRVVEWLEHPYREFPGLNLSFELLSCMTLHTEDGRAGAGKHPCLEGQIVDLADSLAYTTHDLDDGLRSGIITEDQLKEVELWSEVKEKHVPETDYFGYRHQHSQGVIYVMNTLITDLVLESERRIEASKIENRNQAQEYGSFLVGFSKEIKAKKNQLGDFLHTNFYRHKSVCQRMDKAEESLDALFNAFIKTPDNLPEDYRRWAEREGLERAVCDYIAGMTDRFAESEFQRLCKKN